MREKEIRVLQLGKFWPVKGGVEKVEYELATGLASRGVACDMMAAACQGHGGIENIDGNVRLFTSPTWMKLAGTMISPSMVRMLRRECRHYDIIHVHHPDPMAALSLWLSGYKGKVVLHWHSDIAKQKQLLRFFMPLQRWLLRRADVVVGTTPVYVKCSPHLAAVQHKVCCLPIGIAPIRPEVDACEAVRRLYGGRKIVFSLGRLVHYKGYKYLLEAARYLDDSYVVVIGGSGPLGGELQSYVDNQGLGGRVKLIGKVPNADLPAYYGACTLFCLPSVQKTEAFGIVQIEAMSCGKPVVATRIPCSGVAWVNADGYSGHNVEPGNAQELARAIRSIAEDEEAYRRYCRQARQRYEDVFTKERMIDNLLEIYKQCYDEPI